MNDVKLFGSDSNNWSNSTLFLMPNWKWLALAIAIIAGLALKELLKKLFFKMKTSPLVRGKLEGFAKHFLNTDLQTPLAWILIGLFWLATLESLSLPVQLDKYLNIIVKLILAFHAIVLTYRAVEAAGHVILDYTSKTPGSIDSQLAPMATKVLKFLVVVVGTLIVFENFGFKVMPALAGLGLGGLALALAAQDTAANFFGSITIMADRPFHVGDRIKVGETEGIVEDVGIRSTRIRTFYNSLVVMPNSIIAKERVDNFGARHANRLIHTLGLTYETPVTKIQAYMAALEEYLKLHPEIEENISVRFIALGDFNLQIKVIFFIKRENQLRELDIQQEFLFFALKAAEELKVDFAYPTATHILKSAELKS